MNRLKSLLKKIFSLFERPLPFFVTFHMRPKKASRVGISPDVLIAPLPKIAIVMQGPILYTEDFTLETLRLYKKMFPGALLILSTWDYEDAAYIETIQKEIPNILLNPVPEKKGVQNINFQIASSFAGINFAKQKGAEFVLKTRTDQRIYAPRALEFFLQILKMFPAADGYNQKHRLVACSLNSFKYRRYGISDMNLFGYVDDMQSFWGVELDENGSGFKGVQPPISEAYLVTYFLKKIGREVMWTLEDSWEAVAEHFCIVDATSIDLYWYKYARMKEYRYQFYDGFRNDEELSFKEWLFLYSDKERRKDIPARTLKDIIPC